MAATVAREQRFTASSPCPICKGYEKQRRGNGSRCHGFVGGDGRYAHCSREEYAGALALNEESGTYAHRLEGRCRCGTSHGGSESRVAARYTYADEDGTILYEVLRWQPKGFSMRRPDGTNNVRGVRRVLYRLPQLVNADPNDEVYVVEGEKDADRLAREGFIATTNPGGAGKWREGYAEPLRGRHVMIIPDADDEGRRHARAVERSVRKVAASVRVLELPRLPPKGDVTDWLDAGHTVEELRGLTQLSAHTALSAYRPVDDALSGLPGEIVRTIEPHTEADPWALLSTTLCAFGNAVGRRPHMMIGATRHAPRINVVNVGDTGKARKGVSWDEVVRLYQHADPDWTSKNIASGLSSGEGLIWTVRDPVKIWDRKEQKYVIDDPGVRDKRLLVVETELGRTLTVMAREGSILSQLIRQAWDHGNLRNMSRSTNVRATGAHISILAHVTMAELKERLADVDVWAGYANRFAWIEVRRSKLLPRGGRVPQRDITRLSHRLRDAIQFARAVDEMDFDDAGGAAWDAVYRELSEPLPGLLGAITARAEPQVLRLAMTYALMDQSALIRAEDVRAALAVWRHAEATARAITGDASGDRLADRLYEITTEAPDGRRSKNELRDLTGRHYGSEQMDRALELNDRLGRMRREIVKTAGRPREVWIATNGGPYAKSAESAVSAPSGTLVDFEIDFTGAPPKQGRNGHGRQ